MYLRLVRLQGPTDPEAQNSAIESWKANALPSIRSEKGYVGAITPIDRETGEAGVVTYWLDRAALDASEAGARARMARAGESGVEVVDVDTFELAYVERAQPVTSGTYMRANDIAADPGRVDAGVAFVRDSVYPAVKDQPGFRGVAVAVNRSTGRTIVSTTWTTREDLERSDAAVVDLREEGRRTTGASSIKVEVWEIGFAEMLQPSEVRG